MQITIAAIGRLRDPPLQQLIQRYQDRCTWPIRLLELQPKARQSEFELLHEAASRGDRVLALDERGRDTASVDLAGCLERWQDEGCRQLVCLIGGADGLSDDLRKSADRLIAFGQATWPHMIVRLMLCEQLYRASTILLNHPYHRGN